jgi:hypothetical protein
VKLQLELERLVLAMRIDPAQNSSNLEALRQPDLKSISTGVKNAKVIKRQLEYDTLSDY